MTTPGSRERWTEIQNIESLKTNVQKKKREKGEILKMHGCIEMEVYLLYHISTLFFTYMFTMHPCIIDLYK